MILDFKGGILDMENEANFQMIVFSKDVSF